MDKTYRCENPSCTLGARGMPGYFSGGISKEQSTLLTGNPEPEHYGKGVCPVCGEPGIPDSEDRTPLEGHDPHEQVHKEIHARVLDDNDPLTHEGAQEALVAAIGDDHEDEGADDAEGA